MLQLGSGLFCATCGALGSLPPQADEIECEGCGRRLHLSELHIEPQSEEVVFSEDKEWLRDAAAPPAAAQGPGRVIEQKCPNLQCGSSRCHYSALQTRSADEGQTIFYECVECHERFTLET